MDRAPEDDTKSILKHVQDNVCSTDISRALYVYVSPHFIYSRKN